MTIPSGETSAVMFRSLESFGDASITCVASLAPFPEFLVGCVDGSVCLRDLWIGSPVSPAVRAMPSAVTALLLDTRASLVWCGDSSGGVTACRLCPRGGGALSEALFPPARSPHRAAVTALAAADSGALVCSGAADGSVAAWTAAGLVAAVGEHRGPVAALAGAPGGFIVAAGPAAAALHAWRLPGGSNDGELCKSAEGKLSVLAGGAIALRGHTGGVRSCLRVSSGPGALWSGGDDGVVRAWNVHDARHCAIAAVCADGAYEDNEDHALRVMVGHKASVVALREVSGLVFSCDVSGAMLAWSAARCWLLHSFAINAAPRGDTAWLTDAQYIGRVDGFLCAVETPDGWRCVCVPSHPHLRKALRADTGVQHTRSAAAHTGGELWAHAFMECVQAMTDLAMRYAHAHVEAFLSSIDFQERRSLFSAPTHVEYSPRLSLGTKGTTAPMSLVLQGTYASDATLARDPSALEERESLLRTIATLRHREAVRERELTSVRAELSLMRLKHSDWGTGVDEHTN